MGLSVKRGTLGSMTWYHLPTVESNLRVTRRFPHLVILNEIILQESKDIEIKNERCVII
jgi:hypothetical protein